ncbi:MAG: peptidoglycan DD-metalloendopeptidase family protein [Bacteroidales bacterium]|nr:peptidoglycan DD-metalloendopeptidase family protein [Bacteroidales bacterium]
MQFNNAQTRNELEEKRRQTLAEIENMDRILKETVREKSESLNELRIIGNKLNLRESVIKGLQQEALLLMTRIELNTLSIDLMENDLKVLKNEYRNSILTSYKLKKGNSEIGFVLSARDFNQGYKRLKYLQQIAKFRRNESEIIEELKSEIEMSKQRLEEDLKKLTELKTREEVQKSLLESERRRQQRLINTLSNREKQLQKEIDERRKLARRIEDEINKMIENERKAGKTDDLTPEMRALSQNFADNKGKLPWPVDNGIITSKFGIQNHPVLKYVTENNPGIEITSSGITPVRSVFSGEVAKVISIPGANMSIIIRHGKYFSVYSNIVDVKVKTGEKVRTRQELGNVYCEKEDGNKSVLKFMIFDEKAKLDPELWISKKN